MDKSCISPCNHHSNCTFVSATHNLFNASRELGFSVCLAHISSFMFCSIVHSLLSNGPGTQEECHVHSKMPSAISMQTARNVLTIHHSACTTCLAIFTSVHHWRSILIQEKCFCLSSIVSRENQTHGVSLGQVSQLVGRLSAEIQHLKSSDIGV
jgi:hypothetical protein